MSKFSELRRSVPIVIGEETYELREPLWKTVQLARKDAERGQIQAYIEGLHDSEGKPVWTSKDVGEIKALPISIVQALDDGFKALQGGDKEDEGDDSKKD